MPTTLSTDEMKAKVRSHFEDFVNNRKAEVIRTNMTPDFYDHDGPGEEPTDASGDEHMMRQMYSVMPDLHLTIEEPRRRGRQGGLQEPLAAGPM